MWKPASRSCCCGYGTSASGVGARGHAVRGRDGPFSQYCKAQTESRASRERQTRVAAQEEMSGPDDPRSGRERQESSERDQQAQQHPSTAASERLGKHSVASMADVEVDVAGEGTGRPPRRSRMSSLTVCVLVGACTVIVLAD